MIIIIKILINNIEYYYLIIYNICFSFFNYHQLIINYYTLLLYYTIFYLLKNC